MTPAGTALLCPTCRERPPLGAATGSLAVRRCPACQGAFLPPQAATALRALAGRAAAALDGAMSARTTTCPSCGAATPFVALAAGFASACGACATIWADAELMAWAAARTRRPDATSAPPAPPAPTDPPPAGPAAATPSGAAAAPPRPPLPATSEPTAPASPPPAPAGRRVPLRAVVAGAALAGALAVAGAFLAQRPEAASDSPGHAPSDHLTSPLAQAQALGAPAADAAGAAPAQARPARKAPVEILVGGRPPEWWQRRLARLREAPDEATRALYEATLARARAGGLEVSVEGAQVSVVPGPARLAAAEAAP